MSLGFLGIGVADEAEVVEELVTKYIANGGSIAVLVISNTLVQLERIVCGQIGDTFENGAAMDNGFLEDFYYLPFVNTNTEDVVIKLLESDDDVVFASIGDIITIPAGQTTLVSVTGLHLAMTRGKYYQFGALADGVNAGSMYSNFSYIIDYGTSPPMPTKYVRTGKEFESSQSDPTTWYYKFGAKDGNATLGAVRNPMPFNGTLDKVTFSVYQKGGTFTNTFHVYKNGVSVFSEVTPATLGVYVMSPNISFVKGDDICYGNVKSASLSSYKFIMSAGFSNVS